MKKAIVIGAGIGGLSVAARLLSQGFHVEIFEKNPTIGGKTNFLKAGPFQFDLTASILMFPDDYIDVFKSCNKNYQDYFSLIPLNKLYSVFYHDGSKYDFYSDLPKLASTLHDITDCNIEDEYGYFNFISSNYEKYLISNNTILNTSFLKTRDIFTKITLPRAMRLKPLTSSFEELSKYIKNEKLKFFLLYQTMYVGISPYSSPSVYNLIPSGSATLGLYHIEGGMYAYIKALEKLIIEQGGTINTLSTVDKIILTNNKAIGVSVNGTLLYSDLVVCSSDYSYTMQNLLNNHHFSKYIKPINELEYSCSVFILYLALDKKCNINIHNIYINKDFKDNIEAPFNGDLPNDPSLYIYAPSTIDKTLCPPGYETLNIMVRVPNLLNSTVNWNIETIYNLKRKIFSILTKIEGLNDIIQHIIYHKFLTPIDLQNKFNTYGGTAFGLSHNLRQSVIFRPQCEIPKIKNLYFTGASIHPGNGVAMVLKSSKICAKRIKEVHSR